MVAKNIQPTVTHPTGNSLTVCSAPAASDSLATTGKTLTNRLQATHVPKISKVRLCGFLDKQAGRHRDKHIDKKIHSLQYLTFLPMAK